MENTNEKRKKILEEKLNSIKNDWSKMKFTMELRKLKDFFLFEIIGTVDGAVVNSATELIPATGKTFEESLTNYSEEKTKQTINTIKTI